MSSGFIAGISRGHNSGVCLLKNGKVVFSIEEERLTRQKYDGSPLSAMTLIKAYTDKIDYLVISHTQSLREVAPKIEYIGEDIYTGLARKFGLIERKCDLHNHPQVIDVSHIHHKMHCATAFYRSGFESAVAVIVDGAGSVYPILVNNEMHHIWETESIIECGYSSSFKSLYKKYGTKSPICGGDIKLSSERLGETGTHDAVISDTAGITKVYEAITEYCGFQSIEAGKTMGLFPYGEKNKNIPHFFENNMKEPFSNRNLFVPNYPNGAFVNQGLYPFIGEAEENIDITTLKNRRDMAFACQKETQDQVVNLIRRAVEMTSNHNVVLSGGYGLNCVANYHYLDALKEDGITLYVEPISNDGGTAMGAALYQWYKVSGSTEKQDNSIYLGPEYLYSSEHIDSLIGETIKVTDCTEEDVVDLLEKKNIVAMYQGRSENGPRALGNRSILFDPRFKDGKDYVNSIKKREYFRPFAGTILKEYANEWFDLRGLDSSPHMMYAVNCKEGIEDKIPSIIHVDGTCRIQTVTKEENENFHSLLNVFYNKTGIPILFNTSFNLGGEPLVETIDDAIWTLKNSLIEYLYLPEFKKLITVQNL